MNFEAPQTTKSFDEFEPRLKSEIQPENPSSPSNPTSFNDNRGSSNFQQPENSYKTVSEPVREEKPNTVIFSLDQEKSTNTLAQTQSQTMEASVETIESVTSNVDFQKPIGDTLNSTIEERRNRLKQFNFKFKNTLNNAQVDEYETIPAYKRQGLNLSEREEHKPSDFIVGSDSKIRPNNFLHDNVD